MSDDPERVENQPYFKWRRDGSIQTTLGTAGGGVALLSAGLDFSAAAQLGADMRLHLALLAITAVLFGSIILQFRFVVLVLREMCAAIILGAVIGIVVLKPGLGTAALIASGALGAVSVMRMGSPHWETFRTYCKSPEIIPRSPNKQ